MAGNSISTKRKRRPGLTSAPKGYRPPLKTPQLNLPLVDYDEDEDELGPVEINKNASEASGSGSVSPSECIPSEPNSGPPPKRQPKEEDDEEDTFEVMTRSMRARSQSPAPDLGPMRPGEKRRRNEDDDDDLLTRLSKSSKTPESASSRETSAGTKAKGEDPPAKKMKVKFGAVGLAVSSTLSSQSSTPTSSNSSLSSETGKKDGDTG